MKHTGTLVRRVRALAAEYPEVQEAQDRGNRWAEAVSTADHKGEGIP